MACLDQFSEAEELALRWAHRGALISAMAEKQSRDCFGNIAAPSMRVVRKLEKAGLLFITEEDPIDLDGTPFEFTPMLCLTKAGEALFKET